MYRLPVLWKLFKALLFRKLTKVYIFGIYSKKGQAVVANICKLAL